MAPTEPIAEPLRQPPLVIAGGFMPFRIDLTEPVRFFRDRGYQVVVVPYRYRDMSDVRTYAAHIAQTIKDTCETHGVSQVTFIGFSLGGLAGLYALKRLGLAPYVTRFLALGAPLHGAVAAFFALPSLLWSVMGSQVSPGSRFLRELHADALPAGPVYLSIGGNRDAVCPLKTTHLDGARHLCLDFRHLDFFTSETMFSELELYL